MSVCCGLFSLRTVLKGLILFGGTIREVKSVRKLCEEVHFVLYENSSGCTTLLGITIKCSERMLTFGVILKLISGYIVSVLFVRQDNYL